MSERFKASDADVARCKARLIEPGASYLVTRSCHMGQFLWHPTPHMRMMKTRAGQMRRVDAAELLTNTQGFLLGVAAQRFNIGIHNFNTQSNHNHHNVQDRCGLMPEFYRWLNGLLARATNRYRGRPAQSVVLAPGSYNATQITCKESALHSVSYTAIQTVKHGALYRPEHWLGLHADTDRLLEARVFFRDDEFFFRGESDFINDFVHAPREQQLAYLEELAELERQATRDRVAAHIAKLPPGTLVGIDPFAEEAAKARQMADSADYVPVALSVGQLANHGPLVVPPHARNAQIPPGQPRRKSGPLGSDESVTVAVPQAAMKDIAKKVSKELSGRPLPPAVILKAEKHPQWADASDGEYLGQVKAKCEELIAKANEERDRPIVGAKKMRTLYSWTSYGTRRPVRKRPVSKHADGSERLVDPDSIRPNFTARTVGLYRYLTARLKTFRRAYIVQRKAFDAGERDVEFPPGTYLMMVRFHAKCAAPPH